MLAALLSCRKQALALKRSAYCCAGQARRMHMTGDDLTAKLVREKSKWVSISRKLDASSH